MSQKLNIFFPIYKYGRSKGNCQAVNFYYGNLKLTEKFVLL